MPWGLAEETGKSARWLAARSLPCPAKSLLSLLQRHDGAELSSISPVSIRAKLWHALDSNHTLCPIIVGCALNDSNVWARRGELHIERVASPILLLPFLARVASLARCEFTLSWRGAAFSILPESFYIDEDSAAETATAEAVVVISRTHRGGDEPSSGGGGGGVLVEDSVWRALQAFAARIYVPASEESRLRGAGGIGEERGGIIDNN